MRNNMTVQDIFRLHYEDYKHQYTPSYAQDKAARHIMACRTEKLGSHIDYCDNCGVGKRIMHSCRDRSCNLCQTLSKEEWVYNQEQYLLNIPYFHVVFTLPEELNSLIYHDQQRLYSFMFKAVNDTLIELCADEKYLHAQPGFTCVLHTWGQNLCYHPHIHTIISSGGIDKQSKWHKSKDKFFLPVKVLSAVFKGKFLGLVKSTLDMSIEENKTLINTCYKKDFVVYTKKPFTDASHVMKYLGRYTHRVAISNARILKCENGMVTFSYKDYKDDSKWKEMTITAIEFIRRYLLHVLPKGFTKIRHYGYLSNRNKKAKIIVCKSLTNTPILPFKKLTTVELLSKIMHRVVNICPSCGYKRTPMLE